MIDFFFFLFLFVFLIINYRITKKKKLSDNLSNPLLLFGVFFFLIHLLLPYLQWKNNMFRYKSSYDIEVYIYSVFYTFLGYILCFISFHLNLNKEKNILKENDGLDNRFILSKKLIKIIFRINLILYFIALYSAYKVFTQISLIGQEDYLRDRIGLGVGSGFSMLLPHWQYINCLIFFILFSLTRENYKLYNKLSIVFFLISFLSISVYYSTNSNRNSIFILLLNILIIYFVIQKVKIKKLSFKSLIIIIVSILIALFSFYEIGKARHGDYYSDKDYTLLNNLNGAFGNHENIVWLIQEKNDVFFYGETYLAGFANFIPRNIWKDKPLGAGPKMKNFINPGSYVVGKKGNTSLTTGFFNELYMNFGVIGILLGGWFFGFLLKYLFIKLKNANSIIDVFLIQYILIVLASQFVYSEFLGFLARLLITIIPILLIKFYIKKKK